RRPHQRDGGDAAAAVLGLARWRRLARLRRRAPGVPAPQAPRAAQAVRAARPGRAPRGPQGRAVRGVPPGAAAGPGPGAVRPGLTGRGARAGTGTCSGRRPRPLLPAFSPPHGGDPLATPFHRALARPAPADDARPRPPRPALPPAPSGWYTRGKV